MYDLILQRQVMDSIAYTCRVYRVKKSRCWVHFQVDIDKAFDKFCGKGYNAQYGFWPENVKVVYWF